MLGKWPEEGHIAGGVASSTVSQVREIGKSSEPEFYFVSFGLRDRVLQEGFATIILIKARSVYYAIPFLAILKLWRRIRKLRPDIIHVRGGNPSPYLIDALFLARGTKKVVTFGSCETKELVARGRIKRNSLRHVILRWLEKQTALRTDLIVALSSSLAAQICHLAANAEEKTIVVPNAVDVGVFSPDASPDLARKQLGLSQADFVIFHAKAFDPFNGQLFLVKALPKILIGAPNAKLVLAGAGPLLADVRHLCVTLNVSDHVIFPGRVPHQQIPHYLAAADVVVIPSVRINTNEEGSSNFLLEAMAMQKPVVATDVGGNVDAIAHGDTGLLVPDKDAPAIAHAVLLLHGDHALAERLSHNARDYVVKQRTWGENAETILKAYTHLLAREHAHSR
jgi:glycosyltransferase involved in cell wall biosynthesis